MHRAKALLSWSTGKDAAWALQVLQNQGHLEVAALLTTTADVSGRVSMHGVRKELLEAQAAALGLPLWTVPLPSPCPNEAYEARMASVCARAAAEGIGAIAFGDLFLRDIRDYRVQKLAGTGLEPHFPLWGRETDGLAREMVAGGLRATLSTVDLRALGASFAGRTFAAPLLAELPLEVDPCGERGEFHTFVWDGPMFRRPVPIRVGEVRVEGGFAHADLVPA